MINCQLSVYLPHIYTSWKHTVSPFIFRFYVRASTSVQSHRTIPCLFSNRPLQPCFRNLSFFKFFMSLLRSLYTINIFTMLYITNDSLRAIRMYVHYGGIDSRVLRRTNFSFTRPLLKLYWPGLTRTH